MADAPRARRGSDGTGLRAGSNRFMSLLAFSMETRRPPVRRTASRRHIPAMIASRRSLTRLPRFVPTNLGPSRSSGKTKTSPGRDIRRPTDLDHIRLPPISITSITRVTDFTRVTGRRSHVSDANGRSNTSSCKQQRDIRNLACHDN
jgi:hypothetical protein